MEIVSWVLIGVLATTFLIVGYGKLSGTRAYHFAFIRWRLPPSFRIFTGVIEMAGALFLIIGIWIHLIALTGAVLLFCVCIGGTLVHLKSRDSTNDMLPVMLLGLLSLFYIMLLFFWIL